MPSYVSRNGEWFPAEEKVAITDKDGNPKIYEGKDRAALQEIAEGNVTSQPFWKDTEFIARVRQVHNMSMKEYMEQMGFDEKTSNEEFEKKMATPVLHRDAPRKPSIKKRSGGANTAGGGSLEGDFGDEAEARSKIK